MTPPLVSPLGCGQQSVREREESQAAASECQAQPLARAGRRMRSEARRAAEASSAVRPSGQPREREREREREWPVSVPGGQSWCDHSVSHYTVHTLHPHPHQAHTGLHANTFM